MIRLMPAYQQYVWGGSRIQTYFQRELAFGKYAESWELSDRDEGMSVVGSGPSRGASLREWLFSRGISKFPLLTKIIDAAEHLSVQIHPDEQRALELGGEPKSEAWLALEKSKVYAGFKNGVTSADFHEAMKLRKVDLLLQEITLEKGDAIYIPAGQVHAICSGALLLEVQQNSNTTYRLYDWGRQGRQLHLEEALKSIHWDAPQVEKRTAQSVGDRERLISSPYFTIDRISVANQWTVPVDEKFQIVFCIQGNGLIGQETISSGMTYLIAPKTPFISVVGLCELVLICVCRT